MYLSFILKYAKFETNFQIVLVLSVIIICLICIYNRNYFRIVYYLSKIPGPKSYPIIGIGYLLIGKTHAESTQLLFDVVQKFTPICNASIGPIPMILILSPEYVQKILTYYNGLEKPWVMTNVAVEIVANSILSSHVSKWKNNRSQVVRGFTPNIMKSYFKIMIKYSLILCNKLETKLNDANSFDILEYLSELSMNSIAESTLGVNVQDDVPNMYNAIKNIFFISFDRIYSVWKLFYPFFYLSNDFKKLEQNKNFIRRLVYQIISEKKYQKRFASNQNNLNKIKTIYHERSEKTLIEILLDVTENDPLFSDEQLIEEVLLIIIAGFETTANALSYILLNLAAHKDIQEKVYEELLHTLGDSTRVIEMNDLSKLKYMEMVIKESMRLHSTVPIIGRKITKDIKLDENYLIPKGTTVVVPIICLHRNENIWKDPLKFDPERFTLENTTKRHPYAYLPFSGGPRNCLGIRYAWMLMKVVLATLLSRYEFHTDLNVNDLQYSIELSLHLVGGHQLRITPRTKNKL